MDSTTAHPAHDERLAAAARAAVVWARARRTAWEPEPVSAPQAAPPVQPPPLPAVEPVEPRDVAAVPEPVPAVAHFPPTAMATLLVDADAEAPASRGPSAAARLADLTRAVMPVAGRGLIAAVLLAAVIVAGVKGREYWQHRAALAKIGTAVLESQPPGSEVAVDGQTLGTTPLTTTLPAGTHTVEFRDHNATRSMELVVPGGGRVEKRFDWTQKPTGSLQVTTTPGGARVLVDGEDRGVTPLSITGLVAGTHTVVMAGSEGTVQRSVTISENHTTQIDESIFAGWVKVFSPFEVTAAEGGHPLQLDDTGQVMLPAGTHELLFENRRLGYQEVRQVDVQPGGQATISLEPPPSSLTVSASEPAEVWIDGSPAGQTPLVNQAVNLGTRNVVVKNAAGQQRQFVLTVTVKPLVLTVDFSKPPAGP